MNIELFSELLDLAIEQAELYWSESGMAYELDSDNERYTEQCMLEFEDKHQVSLLEWD